MKAGSVLYQKCEQDVISFYFLVWLSEICCLRFRRNQSKIPLCAFACLQGEPKVSVRADFYQMTFVKTVCNLVQAAAVEIQFARAFLCLGTFRLLLLFGIEFKRCDVLADQISPRVYFHSVTS